MPGSLPTPIQATLPQNECIGGTTDDGTGTFALGFINSAGPSSFRQWEFFTIQDGKAVQVGDQPFGGDDGASFLDSQPSGFTKFSSNEAVGDSEIDSYDHGGNLTSRAGLASSNETAGATSAIGVDPSGGTATAFQVFDTAKGWSTVYKRFDKTGVAATGNVTIDTQDRAVQAVGVALSGDALVLVRDGSSFAARWLSREGAALTDWFAVPGSLPFPSVQFLMDGSVVLAFNGGSQVNQYKYQIADGKTALNPAPAFLLQRLGNAFAPVRNGRGYAAWGAAGPCAGSLEVLTTSGKSCGCTKVPQFENGLSIGRDGSLIVGGPIVNFGSCVYDLYPKLLK
jgi:hypothetical protein